MNHIKSMFLKHARIPGEAQASISFYGFACLDSFIRFFCFPRPRAEHVSRFCATDGCKLSRTSHPADRSGFR